MLRQRAVRCRAPAALAIAFLLAASVKETGAAVGKCTSSYCDAVSRYVIYWSMYSATEQESRFLPLCGFCSVFRLNLHVSSSNLISS